MKFLKKLGTGFTAVVLTVVTPVVLAAPPDLDVDAATTYLDTQVGGGMQSVAVVVFGLAAMAMGIKWIKATFFS